MKRLKHNKLRNTGILFEILCRRFTQETLNPSLPQSAIRIIKKHFHKKSELLSELKLYQSIWQTGIVDTPALLNALIESSHLLDRKGLVIEKYNLIRDIRKFYDVEQFFQTPISDYKSLASVYKLFEYKAADHPVEYVSTKQFLIESMNGKTDSVPDDFEWKNESSDVRRLGFKIIVEKFNSKYKKLTDRQKRLLTKYINEDSSKPEFRDFVLTEIDWINKQFDKMLPNVDDNVLRIKLKEVIGLTQNIITSRILKEEHLSSMLKFYELIEEIKK